MTMLHDILPSLYNASMQRESTLEKKCREESTRRGLYLLKWSAPGNAGVPDRILLGPHLVVFIEFKTATGSLTPLQITWGARLTRLKHDWRVIRSLPEFLALLAEKGIP